MFVMIKAALTRRGARLTKQGARLAQQGVRLAQQSVRLAQQGVRLAQQDGVRRKTRRFCAALVVGLLLLTGLVGCRDETPEAELGTIAAAPSLYPITFQLYPNNAVVSIQDDSATLVAMVEQRGPYAAFSLPPGDYRYEVRADGFQTYQGTFLIPQNRNLAVTLTVL